MPIELRTILFGATCGLTAGFAPGPLLALVVSQTVKHNFREGVKVAIVPAFTDLPILLFALALLSRIAHLNYLLGVISFIGAAVIALVAAQNFKTRAIHFETPAGEKPKSFAQGLATNFFQPHPYIFWFGVGAPAILLAWKTSHFAAAGYLVAFLGSMISAKVGVAFMVKQSKGVVPQTYYHWLLRSLGVTMLFFSAVLIHDGLQYWGVLHS
jgi:threonine/homoserine/homoserine lactone efflux protein